MTREYPEKRDSLGSFDAIATQDIRGCLEKADIFINNPGEYSESKSKTNSQYIDLYYQLIKYIALALRPGIVTPTRDERCMQAAFVAKANSGCISRQVGAVVTDHDFAIRAMGWNDVPRGQIPCALRNVAEFRTAIDEVAYSELERTNDKLRQHILEKHDNQSKLENLGIPCPYCFKDAANASIFQKDGNKGNNQVHTRSLHAEENAFLQLAISGAKMTKGRLFTTASPCELCSKKAFQMGIVDIVYIDPYPGISIPHILSSGQKDSRPVLRLFSGAVGKAYHRLYEPMLSIKDELRSRLEDIDESDNSLK